MKVLIVGLGSIGQRHARNLERLLGSSLELSVCHGSSRGARMHTEIDASGFKHNVRSYTDLHDALKEKPRVAFVCNPSAYHVASAIEIAKTGCHVFVEKPISDSMTGVARLKSIVKCRKAKIGVGFQFRFHPSLRTVRELIKAGAIGSVVHAHAHWGEYLPDWHPWEDYRQSYSARCELGGGVLLTLSHPFDYLTWLLGEVRAVSCIAGRVSDLDLDVEDVADVTLQFASGAIGTVHIDYIERPPSHWIRIIGQSGALRWDNADGAVHLYRVETAKWEVFPVPVGFERNTMFLEEVRHFLKCVAGNERPFVSLEDGIRALEIALAAKQSAGEGRVIELRNA